MCVCVCVCVCDGIIEGNGHGKPSSKPGRGYLHFT